MHLPSSVWYRSELSVVSLALETSTSVSALLSGLYISKYLDNCVPFYLQSLTADRETKNEALQYFPQREKTDNEGISFRSAQGL